MAEVEAILEVGRELEREFLESQENAEQNQSNTELEELPKDPKLQAVAALPKLNSSNSTNQQSTPGQPKSAEEKFIAAKSQVKANISNAQPSKVKSTQELEARSTNEPAGNPSRSKNADAEKSIMREPPRAHRVGV